MIERGEEEAPSPLVGERVGVRGPLSAAEEFPLTPTLLLVALLTTGCSTLKLSVAGEAAVDARVFVQPPRYSGQEDGNTVSLVAAPTGILDIEGGTHVFRLTPFYRLCLLYTSRCV